MTIGETLGWLAAALTLLTFSMRSMVALRLVAIAANVLFIAYGAMGALAPVLVLHLLLIPCNLVRLWQLSAAAQPGDGTGTAMPATSDEPRRRGMADGAGRDWLMVQTSEAYRFERLAGAASAHPFRQLHCLMHARKSL